MSDKKQTTTPANEQPAFPGSNFGGMGLSKLEWFAAHAPTKVPKWFKPVVSKKPELPLKTREVYSTKGSTGNGVHPNAPLFDKFFDDEEGKFISLEDDSEADKQLYASLTKSYKNEVEKHWKERNNAVDKLIKWEAAYKVAVYFQWRIFYAKKMIEGLEIENTKARK